LAPTSSLSSFVGKNSGIDDDNIMMWSFSNGKTLIKAQHADCFFQTFCQLVWHNLKVWKDAHNLRWILTEQVVVCHDFPKSGKLQRIMIGSFDCHNILTSGS